MKKDTLNPGEPKTLQGDSKRSEERHAVWRSLHSSQAAAWQSPRFGKQQAVQRALQPHACPFQLNSSHPPDPDCDIFRRKGRAIPNLPPPGKDKLEILEP